jgi:hypothetical protein
MAMNMNRIVAQSVGQALRKERAKGNVKGADGWGLIMLGIITLPIPIIGIPLIVAGAHKLCSKE